MNEIRTFESGANRNSAQGKLDGEGFNNPLVDVIFDCYMHRHRKLQDGTMRDSDNWQKGIPKRELVKSGYRHYLDVRLLERGYTPRENVWEALGGARFNISALMLEEALKAGFDKMSPDAIYEVMYGEKP